MRYIRSQITWLASKALASDFQTNTHLLKAEPRRKCEEGLRCGRPRGKTVVYGLIQAELSRLGGKLQPPLNFLFQAGSGSPFPLRPQGSVPTAGSRGGPGRSCLAGGRGS